MNLKALIPFALGLCAAGVVAQDKKDETAKPAAPKFERATATGKLDAGTMTVEYGQPKWNDKFAGAVKAGAPVWRLGDNDPTVCKLDCGLMSANGPIVPGEYKLGLKYVKDGLAHLVVYQGATFYNDALPTWEIASESVKSDAAKAEKLEIKFDGNKMHVAFGPYLAVFGLKAVKAHPPVNTEFAGVDTEFHVLALPLDGPVKDLNVGAVKATMGEITTSWNLLLTIDGDTAKLTFKNADAATLPKDKETVGGIVKRLGEMGEQNAAMKEQLAGFVTHFKNQMERLEAKEKALARLGGAKTLETKVSKRAAATKTLEFKHERPEGKIVLMFGANEADASFDVVPREFRQRRQG